MTHADAATFVAMRTFALVLVGATSTGVVLVRDPTKQAIAVSFYGLVLAIAFFLFQAPDVSLAQLVVGAVALPLMILLALVKMRRNELAHAKAEREEGRGR